MRGLCLSLPRLATSRQLPPGPAQPRGLTQGKEAAGASHGGAVPMASDLMPSVAAAWGGPLCTGRGQGPPRNCPPCRKVTGKCRGSRHRARRAPAPGTNATHRARPRHPTPAPLVLTPSYRRQTVEPGAVDKLSGDRDPATSGRAGWSSHPSETLSSRTTPDPTSRTLPASFPGGKLRLREAKGEIRTRGRQRALAGCQAWRNFKVRRWDSVCAVLA